MKRIGASKIHNTDIRMEASTGGRCPESGWWIPLGSPEGRTYVWKGLSMPERAGRHVEWLLTLANTAGLGIPAELQSTSTDDNCQTWGQELWPDCLD